MPDIQLVDTAVEVEFSISGPGEMLRGTGRAGLYLRRESPG